MSNDLVERLEEVIGTIRSGDFYKDYDASTAALGVLREAANALRTQPSDRGEVHLIRDLLSTQAILDVVASGQKSLSPDFAKLAAARIGLAISRIRALSTLETTPPAIGEAAEPVGWRETVTAIRDLCSRRPSVYEAKTKDQFASVALSNSADLGRIMEWCNGLLHRASASREVADLLDELAKHPSWEIDYGPSTPNDEESDYAWRVFKVTGNINDREWTLLGFGNTPCAALTAALSSKGGVANE